MDISFESRRQFTSSCRLFLERILQNSISGDQELIKLSHFIWPCLVGKCASIVVHFPGTAV